MTAGIGECIAVEVREHTLPATASRFCLLPHLLLASLQLLLPLAVGCSGAGHLFASEISPKQLIFAARRRREDLPIGKEIEAHVQPSARHRGDFLNFGK